MPACKRIQLQSASKTLSGHRSSPARPSTDSVSCHKHLGEAVSSVLCPWVLMCTEAEAPSWAVTLCPASPEHKDNCGMGGHLLPSNVLLPWDFELQKEIWRDQMRSQCVAGLHILCMWNTHVNARMQHGNRCGRYTQAVRDGTGGNTRKTQCENSSLFKPGF